MKALLTLILVSFGFVFTLPGQEFPGTIRFRDKTFNTQTFQKLLETVKEENVWLENCQINFTSGLLTETGFDESHLLIPANISYISFDNCKFNSVSLTLQNTDTQLYLTGCRDNYDFLMELGKSTRLRNCDVTKAFLSAKMAPSDSLYIELLDVTAGQLTLTSGVIVNLRIEGSRVNRLQISHCQIPFTSLKKDAFSFDAKSYQFFDDISGDSISGLSENNYYDRAYAYPNYLFTDFQLYNNEIGTLSIEKSYFNSNHKSVFPIYNCRVEDLLITDSRLGTIDLFNTSVNDNLIFRNFQFTGINVYKCQLPSSNVAGFVFDEYLISKLFIFDPTNIHLFSRPIISKSGTDSLFIDDHSDDNSSYSRNKIDTLSFHDVIRFNGGSADQIKNKFLFSELINDYAKLYNIYKDRGDIASSNACYAKMKDLMLAKLRYQHEENPTFRNFFAWQLAWLVKVYTNHGTDPALAITISFWIICAFAVFFFFFPSDWDTSSKRKLIENYRDFVQKNEKGYIKPFFMMTGGFLLSFVNALTLSLNAYTTLGFGNIPTHGLARYACVVEGFIGWFMLSIFTVALINQVLT